MIKNDIKWAGITGSWRPRGGLVRYDVERTVDKILETGAGIITGGALGVDYFATKYVLGKFKLSDLKDRIKIYLPNSYPGYLAHYGMSSTEPEDERELSRFLAEKLTNQLKEVFERDPDLIQDKSRFTYAHVKSFYARNTKVVEKCDILFAFHVDNSRGVLDAIIKGKKRRIPVDVKSYETTRYGWTKQVGHKQYNIPKKEHSRRTRSLMRPRRKK